MKPPVQNIRISQRGKEALQRLKNRTGIPNWNVLCRWALSTSLTMETAPPRWIAQEESNIDMDWKTFAGDQADILSALVYLSAEKHGESKTEALPGFFRAHLERGINAIQNVKKLSDIAQLSN